MTRYSGKEIAESLAQSVKTDVAAARNQREIEKNVAAVRLNLNPDMLMVKDFYWAMKLEGMEISPEQAASQCDIDASKLSEWMENVKFSKWFFEPPVKLKSAIKGLTFSAIRECRKLLQDEDPEVRMKMAKYLIDQATGKAAEKKTVEQFDDEEELEQDMKELEALLKKVNDGERAQAQEEVSKKKES